MGLVVRAQQSGRFVPCSQAPGDCDNVCCVTGPPDSENITTQAMNSVVISSGWHEALDRGWTGAAVGVCKRHQDRFDTGMSCWLRTGRSLASRLVRGRGRGFSLFLGNPSSQPKAETERYQIDVSEVTGRIPDFLNSARFNKLTLKLKTSTTSNT